MKMTIKELKAKGEKEDKVKFIAKVKNVYDAKEAITKYTVSRQNIIVEDENDNIKIIVSHKKKEDEYEQDIVGKEVNVEGKISLWEGKMNIFGKLIFKEGEAPLKKDNSTIVRPATISVLPAGIELRKISLKMAIDFWGSRIGHEKDEKGIIETADKFKDYLIGKEKASSQKNQKKEKKEEKSEIEKEGEEIKKEEEISTEKIALINKVMKLKEDHHLDAETFAIHCDKKDIKTLSIEELKVLKTKLENLTEEIPF